MEIKYGRKRSGIKRELKSKITEWLESIDDKDVRKAAKKDVIVTGGAICSMLLGEPINDFDLYFRTKKTTKMLAEYYVNKFNTRNKLKVGKNVSPYTPIVREETLYNIKGESEDRVTIFLKSAGVAAEKQDEYNYFETLPPEEAKKFAESLEYKECEKVEDYRVVFMSQNAITLSNKIQLVIRFYGEPEQIHDNYDFIHATCYWDHHKEHLELPAEALEAMMSRSLVYRGSLYPVASIFRTKKFLERGWRITAAQLLKMMWQISEIDLSDYETLREQLTGVDMAYMYELVKALSEVDTNKLNSAYICTIIDRIFD